jgi:hypothetical protein
MRLVVELFGLLRIKLSCNMLTLAVEEPPGAKQVSLEEVLHRLEALYAEQRLKLIEDGEIRKGILVMRKDPVCFRTQWIPELRNQWINEREIVVLATVMAGG